MIKLQTKKGEISISEAVFANITAFARVNYSKRILKASNK